MGLDVTVHAVGNLFLDISGPAFIVGAGAKVLAESNHFESVNQPIVRKPGQHGVFVIVSYPKEPSLISEWQRGDKFWPFDW